jgi:hypothetical protein
VGEWDAAVDLAAIRLCVEGIGGDEWNRTTDLSIMSAAL